MAEVRLRFGKGVYYFLNNSYKHSPLGIDGTQFKSTTQAAFLSMSSRPSETLNTAQRLDGKTCKVLDTNDRKCCGISRSSSTVGGRERIHELNSYLGLKNINGRLLNGLTRNEFEEDLKFDIRTSDVCIKSTGATVSKDHHVFGSRYSTGRRMNGVVVRAATTFLSKHEHRRALYFMFANREVSPISLPVCQKQILRAYGSYSDGSEPLYKTKTGYYDVLDVSVNATNAQIKTAYYKQSFVYHPDKNAGSEVATLRFSEISEAYNVLGNKALRRKYDRGILSHSDLIGAGKPSAKDTSPSASQPTRKLHSPAVGTDSQNIFDFDNFIKSHYGDQLQRDKEIRERKEDMLRKKEGTKELELGKMMEMAVGLLLITAVVILVNVKQGGN